MRLLIANCTKQNRKINYRLDFGRDGSMIMDPRFRYHRPLPIKAGTVVEVPGLVHESQCTSIMNQLEKYGARQVSEKNRLPNYVVPYLMSVDAPISPRAIAEVLAHNNGVKTSEGSIRRQKAAISATDAIVKSVEDAQVNAEVKAPEVQYLQETLPDEPAPPSPAIAERFGIAAADAQSPPPASGGNRAARRGRANA